jgi:polyhydroxybutyrate depolymerase
LAALATAEPYGEIMAARIVVLRAVLLVVVGCAARLHRGLYVAQDELRWTDRSYRPNIPAGLASPAPLAVMMHGGFGSAQHAERAYGWDELANAAKHQQRWPQRRPGH